MPEETKPPLQASMSTIEVIEGEVVATLPFAEKTLVLRLDAEGARDLGEGLLIASKLLRDQSQTEK
jgi:hypothetical protein